MVIHAFILEDVLQAQREVIVELAHDFSCIFPFYAEEAEDESKDFMAVEVPAGIHEDVEDTDGLAAQGEGVLRTGRNEAAAEHARNGIEFIGNAQDLAHVGLRQDVAGKTRLVLFVNGFGNAFIFTVDEGIFLAHDALEFGEFHDHLRSQVGFRQERSALQFGVIQAEVEFMVEEDRDLFQALRFVIQRSQAILEDDFLQFFCVIGEGMFLIFFKEEFGIVQAGAEDAFIAVLDRFQMVIVAVADGQEQVHELAVFIAHREIALMVLHRRDDGGFRQFQVIFIKFPTKGCRIFDEVDDFFQEVVVHDDGTALFISQLLQAVEDHLLADFRVDDEEMFLARFFISCRAFDCKIASTQETMAAADLARLDVSQFKGNDIFIEEGDEPADRTDEVEVQAAPVHAFREIEACDDAFEDVRQEGFRFSADAGDVGVNIAIFDDEVLDVDFLTPGKAHGGFRRVAVGIISDFDRRTFMF